MNIEFNPIFRIDFKTNLTRELTFESNSTLLHFKTKIKFGKTLKIRLNLNLFDLLVRSSIRMLLFFFFFTSTLILVKKKKREQ